MIFEPGTNGSMLASDTLFRKRYGRSYFGYFVDTVKQQITFRQSGRMSDSLFSLQYTIPDSTTIILRGTIRGDTLYVRLKRSEKNYYLSQWRFNWLTNYVK